MEKEKEMNQQPGGDQEIPENLGEVDGVDAQEGDQEEAGVDLETLRQELDETRDRLLRVAADAENFKKRMEREKEKILKYAGENILRELLTTADNLERALEQGRAEGGDPEKKLAAMLEGLELTYKGLMSLLEKFEVTPLDSAGQPFNPDEMDALTMEESDEVPANHVIREFARGYRFKDRVLRHAQVVVSSGKKA